MNEDSSYLHGFAAALGALIRLFDRPALALAIAHADGLDLDNFVQAGVEPFDLEPIKEAFHGLR